MDQVEHHALKSILGASWRQKEMSLHRKKCHSRVLNSHLLIPQFLEQGEKFRSFVEEFRVFNNERPSIWVCIVGKGNKTMYIGMNFKEREMEPFGLELSAEGQSEKDTQFW